MSSAVCRWDHRIDNVMRPQANRIIQHRPNRSTRQQDATSGLEDSVRNVVEAYLRKARCDVLRREGVVCDSFGGETGSHLAGVRICGGSKPEDTCVDEERVTGPSKKFLP